MSGVKRSIHNKIHQLLDLFPAVVILGVRQSGKTFLASQSRPGWRGQVGWIRISAHIPITNENCGSCQRWEKSEPHKNVPVLFVKA